MNVTHSLLAAGAATVVVYAAFVVALLIAGRREDGRAVARLVPDAARLLKRLATDPRVPRRRKMLAAALLAYLLCPLDLVPDFVPVAGQLDDALVLALGMRVLLRGGGRNVVIELWPGPRRSLDLVLRLA